MFNSATPLAMLHATTRLENFCAMKETAAQRFISLLPVIPNIDKWVNAVLSSDKRGRTIHVEFSGNFQARFAEFLGFVCEILGRPNFDAESMKHINPLFLFYFAPEDARDYICTLPNQNSFGDSEVGVPDRKTVRYLEYRAREIVSIFQSLRKVLLKSAGLVVLCHFYSNVQLFYSTSVYSTFKARVQMDLVVEVEKLMRDIVDRIEDMSSRRKAVRSEKDGHIVALALSMACTKILNVVCCLLNREAVTDVQSHFIFLAVLRCHGITSGRVFVKGTQMAAYEDHTGACLSKIFMDVCRMVKCQVFTSTVLPTESTLFNRCVLDDFPSACRLLRIDRLILFQLADSVQFYLDCVRMLSPNFNTIAITYEGFQPDPWDLVGSYDKRVFLDLAQQPSQAEVLMQEAPQPVKQEAPQPVNQEAPQPVQPDSSDWDVEAYDLMTI